MGLKSEKKRFLFTNFEFRLAIYVVFFVFFVSFVASTIYYLLIMIYYT